MCPTHFQARWIANRTPEVFYQETPTETLPIDPEYEDEPTLVEKSTSFPLSKLLTPTKFSAVALCPFFVACPIETRNFLSPAGSLVSIAAAVADDASTYARVAAWSGAVGLGT